ncbi:MAG: M23 family metallopeptidase [Deltaproteobacteria bacterium]|nr:M23 family metallopeptidase [Deltaproteobacteria bacterium]
MLRRGLFFLLPAVGCATSDGTSWRGPPSESLTRVVGSCETVGTATTASCDAPRGLLGRVQPLGLLAAGKSISIEGPVAVDPDELPDVESVATSIARRVPAFANERRKLGARASPTSKAWPLDLEAVFRRFLEDMHEDLARVPLGELPRRLLVQTRVAAEYESEMSERAFGPPPDEIKLGLRRLFRMVTLHMQANAEINGLTPHTPPGRMRWPVSPVLITSYFGFRKDPVQEAGEGDDIRFHRGLDLGGRMGDPVYSATRGRVIHTGWLGGYGRAVILLHESGIQTVYGHLSLVLVELGDEIEASTPVGLMGQSGRATGPHLHFEVRRDGQPIDPLDMIGSGLGDVARASRKPLEAVALR